MTRNPVPKYPFFSKVIMVAAVAALMPWFASARVNNRPATRAKTTAKKRTYTRHRHYYRGLQTYISDPGAGDETQFDDPVVRQAALDALGRQNGSVVAVDPSNGRILSIVNQKLAYSAGFEPCSTIKPVIAVAALEKGIITPDTMVRIGRRRYMDLTEALAHSNNQFFEELGRRLGFPTVWQYDHIFGLGERTGFDIDGEKAGFLPSTPPTYGGVARMCSFGEGIRITPLQLAAIVSTIANGGTMYYLQYPQSTEEIRSFAPRVHRTLEIAPMLPDLRQGMLAAVLYGTARQSNDPDGEQALGKTGTCNDETQGGRLGWFASYAGQQPPSIVLVVLLRGQMRIVNGPHAADVAGKIYHDLYEQKYFVAKPVDNASVATPGGGR